MKKAVMLTIRGEQRYQGLEPDVIELMTEGTMEPAEDGWDISYQESDLTGLQGTFTTFAVRPGHVTLAREGALQSRMEFQEGVRHDSLYQMDVGALMVRVCARRIRTELTENGGFFEVFYSIEVEQSATGTVRYHIDVKPVE